uniref:Si:ch211-231m23.4 n=1 Tax=Cynoglossus semilaevis TaxID=244447 RepID=A0A3P8UGW7_CYNSE
MEVVHNIILAVYIISFLIGLPANLLALYAFSVKICSKPQPTDILLLNLTVSDLLFLFVLPMKMHEAASGMIWTFPAVLCSITSFIYFSTIYSSSLLLMAISVIRYVGVAFPIFYLRVRRPLYAVVASAVIWLLSMGHCSITIIIENHPYFMENSSQNNSSRCYDNFQENQLKVLLPVRLEISHPNTCSSISSSFCWNITIIIENHPYFMENSSQNNSSRCYDNFQENQLKVLLPVRLEMFLLLCLFPLLLCIYCYLHTIWILSHRTSIDLARRRKAIGMALGTLAVFLVCMIPYNLSHVVGYVQRQSPIWRYYVLLLTSLNTCIDPIIFYFSSSTSTYHTPLWSNSCHWFSLCGGW